MESLPSELMVEILGRTALESLDDCKSVCKDWKDIIKEPSFIHLHSERSNSILGYFIQDVKHHSKYPWSFLSPTASAASIKPTWPSDDIKILASSDQGGILICERRVCYNARFYACKPATGQWQALPNPKLRYQTAAIAVVVLESQPLRYLIARLYCSETRYHCEMFDSQIWRWEKMECPLLNGDEVIKCDPPVTTAGGRFVHWLTFNNKVVTLDVKKRGFECWEVPEKVWCNDRKRLVEFEGRLRIMCRGRDAGEMELWDKREKKMVVRIESDLDYSSFHHFCSSNLVFVTTTDGSSFYHLSNSAYTKMQLSSDLRCPHRFHQRIFPFKSDINIVRLKPLPS